MAKKTSNTYDTSLLRDYLLKHGIGAMDLVRMTSVSVGTAYRIVNGEPLYDLDVFYNVYMGLKESGREVTWDEMVEIP